MTVWSFLGAVFIVYGLARKHDRARRIIVDQVEAGGVAATGDAEGACGEGEVPLLQPPVQSALRSERDAGRRKKRCRKHVSFGGSVIFGSSGDETFWDEDRFRERMQSIRSEACRNRRLTRKRNIRLACGSFIMLLVCMAIHKYLPNTIYYF